MSASASLAGHLVALDGGDWALWRDVCVRGAGFPVDRVLAFAAPALAVASDRLVGALDAVDAARVAVGGAIDARWGAASGDERQQLARLRRRIAGSGLVDGGEGIGPDVAAAVSSLRARLDEAAAARAALEALFVDGQRSLGEAYHAIGHDPRFREALAWQNRSALHGSIDALLRRPPEASDSTTRRHRGVVASYLQRYCVKNDSIGFFGPIGWATIDPAAPAFALRPGPSLLARRTVFFEHWAIERLAETIAALPGVRRFLPPRRLPTLRLDGTTLHVPIGRTATLPDACARLLAVCDGTRSAEAIARALVADSTVGLDDEEEVYELLEQLADQRLLVWTLEIPTGTIHPERALRERLAAIADEGLRRDALARLERLEAGRDAVARAAGNWAALDEAMAALEARFAEETGASGTRREGQTYAARTVVYEDCRRDLELTIGPAVVDALAPPLTLLLDSARWFTSEIARGYAAHARAEYAALCAEGHGPAIDYLRFWERLSPSLPGTGAASPIIARAAATLKERWDALLAPTDDPRRVERTARSLAPRVAEAFAAPHAGWPTARYHSPDLMIAARDADAIARGDFTFVLGEVHPSVNTPSLPFMMEQHAEPARLVRAREIDQPAPFVEPVTSSAQATRADHHTYARHDRALEIGATPSWRPRAEVLAVADLVVEETADGALVVRTRDGSFRLGIVDFLDYYLSAETLPHFHLLPARPHAPRVTIDRLVVCRETWRFDPARLEFPSLPEAADRFVAARRWARAEGLPRFVFFKIPEEPKPFYCDFDAPAFVDNLAKMARKATALVVSEMLPSPDEVWLVDGEGLRYTSELRIAALDLRPTSDRSVP